MKRLWNNLIANLISADEKVLLHIPLRCGEGIATLMERTGRSRSEVFSAALACFDLLTELEEEGCRIKIVDADGDMHDLDISRLDAPPAQSP